MSRRMTQLPLFSAEMEAERTLREKYDLLTEYCRDAEARLEKARVTFRALREERKALGRAMAHASQETREARQERDSAIRERDSALRAAEVWRGIANATALDQLRERSIGPTMEPTLKKLLTLAHPDKWSQGQPATELAHELTVLINQVRDEGRP